MAATPGPSNALLTAAAAQVGILRALPALLGVAVGMAALMFGVTLGLGALIMSIPLLLTFLRVLGGGVLLYLAYQLATSTHGVQARSVRPVGFAGAAAFQLVNPKSWLACASAAAAFSDPASSPSLHAATLTLIFVVVAIPSCAAWLGFGALVQHSLRSPRARRVFNLTMSGLLAISVLLLWLG